MQKRQMDKKTSWSVLGSRGAIKTFRLSKSNQRNMIFWQSDDPEHPSKEVANVKHLKHKKKTAERINAVLPCVYRRILIENGKVTLPL